MSAPHRLIRIEAEKAWVESPQGDSVEVRVPERIRRLGPKPSDLVYLEVAPGDRTRLALLGFGLPLATAMALGGLGFALAHSVLSWVPPLAGLSGIFASFLGFLLGGGILRVWDPTRTCFPQIRLSPPVSAPS